MIKKLLCFILIPVFCMSVFAGCRVRYDIEEEETPTVAVETFETKEEPDPEGVIRIRYSNNDYTAYLKECKEAFEKKYENTSIVLDLVDKDNYLEKINSDSRREYKHPDLYILNNDELSTAYLAGLTSKIQSDDFISENFDTPAVNACSYNSFLCAYPLGFKTSFLVYNADCTTEDKSYTFDDIKYFSENADYSQFPEGIEYIFDCNISDILLNYGFIGSGFNLGGKFGTQKKIFNICNDTTIDLANDYVELVEYFSFDKNSSYRDVLDRVLEGKTVFSIVSTESLGELIGSGRNFKFSQMPDYDEETKTAPLSITSSVVINPYSKDTANATLFARFITGEYVDRLYETTGILPANKRVMNPKNRFYGIYESYLKSDSKTKVQYGEQVYPLIEIALHNILDGEDIRTELQAVDDFMKKQLS